MRIIFLGTGSAMPSPRRSMPAVAIVRLGEVFLLDCGEGTQFRYRDEHLRYSRLRWLLISHLHGDHVLGLPGLLMSLQMSERTEPLEIVGPEGIREYVLANRRLLRTEFGYPLVFTELSGDGGVVYDGPEYVIEAGRLHHGVPTFGFAVAEKDRPGPFDVAAARALRVPEGPLWGQLQHLGHELVGVGDGLPGRVLAGDEARPGYRVAYVADTRPCANAAVLGRGADVLIHEATFAGDLLSEAKAKQHCTVTEAAQVGLSAGARRLVLTHFSSRYVDLGPLRREADEVFPGVELAADGLTISLGE
ncbi:MAG: ribonuclease Z [Armatimonadetes bacterium]|nr:ribonuclease Z [Armatimonadota bacterium]